MNIVGNTVIMDDCYDNDIDNDDWQFTLIEQYETHEQLEERKTFWQHRLKTYYPYGLNEKKKYLC